MGEYNAYTGGYSGDGSAEVTISNGMVTSVSRSSEFQAATDFAKPGDVLSTAKTPEGSAIGNRAPRATDVVKFGGQTMTIAQAEGLQFVTRDAGGNFIPTAQGLVAGQSAEGSKGQIGLASGGTAEEAQASGFRADDVTEAAFIAIGDHVSPDVQIAAMDSVLGNDGQADPRVIGRMASQAGVEPAEMEAAVETARDGMEEAVYRRLEAEHGVYDRDAFARYVHGSPQTHARMLAAARDLVLTNSFTGLAALAKEAGETADVHDKANVEEALRDSGIAFTRNGNSGLVLDLRAQGLGQMTFKAAVQNGFIKLRRNG